jgi:broad specificity phosphatase PhoE
MPSTPLLLLLLLVIAPLGADSYGIAALSGAMSAQTALSRKELLNLFLASWSLCGAGALPCTAAVEDEEMGEILRSLPPPAHASTKRIVLCRHAETMFNAKKVVQGLKLNPDINDRGREQARALGLALKDLPASMVLTSPLKRAMQTGREVADAHHPPLGYSVCPSLVEIDMGRAEGRSEVAGAVILASAYGAWSEGKEDVRAGKTGESASQVKARVKLAARALLDAAEPGYVSIGLTHSSLLKFMLAQLLGVQLATIRASGQRNASINILECSDEGCFSALVINNRRIYQRLG